MSAIHAITRETYETKHFYKISYIGFTVGILMSVAVTKCLTHTIHRRKGLIWLMVLVASVHGRLQEYMVEKHGKGKVLNSCK